MPFDRTGLIAKLNALGDTGNAVAVSLRKLGIKGRRDDGCACPLANYVSVCIGLTPGVPPRWITVTPGIIQISAAAFGEREVIVTTQPWREFISNFDSGDYPDLDLEETHAV